MHCILMEQDAYHQWVLANPEIPVFNDLDGYTHFEEFPPEMTRDQIRLAVEEYRTQLRNLNV